MFRHFLITHEKCTLWNLLIPLPPYGVYGGYLLTRVRVNLLNPKSYFYAPPASKDRNSVFCPHCIYVFCMDLRTAIVSLYSIKLPVFITKAESLIFVVPSIMLYSSEISPTRCNSCVFILRNGFTLHVSGDSLTHHQ
jgi:hypothetical protein